MMERRGGVWWMMERKGGCCLAPRYGAAAGAVGQASMPWQTGSNMLKFRPIAPKSAAMAPSPTPASVTAGGAGRGKRKAVGGGGGSTGRRGRKPKKATTVAAVTPVMAAAVVPKASDDKDREKEKSLSSPSSSSSGMTSVDSSPPPASATLPLMPVASVENGKEKVAAALPARAAGQVVVVAPRALRPAASLVTVEDVTGTWREGQAASAAACAGVDEIPAFVSDQWGSVTWTNAAFNRAVSAPGDDASPEVRVGLAAKGGSATVPEWGTCTGFTCRVRVRYACPRRGSFVAPCDVWRLDAGGYLWRLDLKAALSLRLGALPYQHNNSCVVLYFYAIIKVYLRTLKTLDHVNIRDLLGFRGLDVSVKLLYFLC